MRAELRLIRRHNGLVILLIRDPVIIPVIGIDAAINAFDIVRPRDEIAISFQLKLS